MTYNTSNPLGSTDPRDLSDNAENLDRGANSALPSFVDRLGVTRDTWAGHEMQFDAAQAGRAQDFQSTMDGYGYLSLGAYAAGLEFTLYNQTFSYAGEFYAPPPSMTLPYTTTGSGAAEVATFRSVGDAVLRSDLAASSGASLVGWSRSPLSAAIATAGQAISSMSVNIWEYANLATGYAPGGDISTWDWQPAIQAAVSGLSAGETLYFPAPHIYRVVNATGAGAGAIAQRADAVLNSTLYAITSATDNIGLRIDGTIKSTSLLDDVFRLSGKRAKVTGTGTIRGPGIFHDTNPSGAPVTDQWYPSLMHFTGDDSGSEGVLYYDQPTIGIRIRANRCYARFNRFVGGLVVQGAGTMLMGIYAGDPVGGTYGSQLIGNTFGRSLENGSCYSGIFSTDVGATMLFNEAKTVIQHGIYNYGAGANIGYNLIDGSEIGAGIQVFATGCTIDHNTVKNSRGGIALENANQCKVLYNTVWEGIALSGISVSTFIGTNPANTMEDLEIIGNFVNVTIDKQSCIDVGLEHGIRNLIIRDNTVQGAPIPGASGRQAAIAVRALPAAGNPGSTVSINGNSIRLCDGYAISVDRCQGFDVSDNSITDVNGLSSDTAIFVASSAYGQVNNNQVRDTRGTPKTSVILSAISADLNANILANNNNGITLLASANALCLVPTNSVASGNTQDSLGDVGVFTMTATATLVVNAAASPQAASIRAGARITLEPDGKAATDQQAGAQRLYVSNVSAGQFTVTTSDSTAAVAANYVWRVVQ